MFSSLFYDVYVFLRYYYIIEGAKVHKFFNMEKNICLCDFFMYINVLNLCVLKTSINRFFMRFKKK